MNMIMPTYEEQITNWEICRKEMPVDSISLSPILFDFLKIMDCVCLPHFPYKAFCITSKGENWVKLESKGAMQIYSKQEFEEKGYHLSWKRGSLHSRGS